MARCPLPTALLLCLAAAGILAGADEPVSRTPLPGESVSTARRLAAADTLAEEGKTAEAAEEYARILEEAGNDLVPVSERHLLRVRWLCHARLAALPSNLLRGYRNRVENQARKWLDEGIAARDPRLLRRVVEEAFCSRAAEPALDLLGDLALERGEFQEAARWWRMIALPASEAAARAQSPRPPPWQRPDGLSVQLDLIFPDPQGDVARVRGKQVLAALFRGRREEAAEELKAFRAQHPAAEGQFAGRRGKYAETLQALLDRPPAVAEPPDDWPTFAGDPSRNHLLAAEPLDPNRLLRVCRDGPVWRFRLDTKAPVKGEPAPPSPRTVEKAVAVAEHARSLAFHPVIAGDRVLVGDAHTVTAYDVSTGAVHVWDLNSVLPAGEKINDKGPRVTTALPAPPDLRYTLTVGDGRVYARLGVLGLPPDKSDAQADSFLVCLELTGPGNPLRPLWVRKAQPKKQPSPPVFEGAPVVRDGRLYVAVTRFSGNETTTAVHCYSTEAGDAPPRWSQDVFVARDDARKTARFRHHLLTLAGPNVVYATHAGAVVALDAETGRRAWAVRYPSKVVNTPLGGKPAPRDLCPCLYADGHVYAAPADDDRLLCLDPLTGQVLWEREGVIVVQLLGVAAGRLFFTTLDGMRALSALDGRGGWAQPDLGTLTTWGRGFLAGSCVFWPTTAGVYVLDQQSGMPPDDLIPLHLHNLPPGNTAYADGCLAVAGLHELAIYLAPARRPAERRERARANPDEFSVPLRLEALSRRAAREAATGQPARAVLTWQTLLADGELRQGVLRDSLGRPQRAEVVAAERIDELVAAHGLSVYAGVEQQARSLLEAARGEERAAALERVTVEYPNSAAAVTALQHLAKLHEEAGRRGAAAHAYRRLLHRPRGPDDAAAQAGLARCERRPNGDVLPNAWETRAEDEERFLPLCNAPAAGPADLPFARGREVVCRDAATGKRRWACPLSDVPVWAGCHADFFVVATPTGIAALACDDGRILWQFPAPSIPLSDFRLAGGRLFCLQQGERFLALAAETGRVLWQRRAPSAGLADDLPAARFSRHYLAGEDAVWLQTGGRAWRLDAATGRAQHEAVTSEQLWPQPPVLLDGGRACWVSAPWQVVCFDTASGRSPWSYTLERSVSLTGEPPTVCGAGDVLLVFIPRNHGCTLQRLDVQTGRPLWPGEVLLGPDRIGPASVAVDGAVVYLAGNGAVTARSVADGRVLWKQSLPTPAGEWRLLRGPSALVAYPADAPQAKLHSRWLLASLELTVTCAPEDRPGRGFPVLLLDPKTGEAARRLSLEMPSPRARLRARPAEEWQGSPEMRVTRAPDAEARPVVQLVRQGMVIAWEGKAWMLPPEK